MHSPDHADGGEPARLDRRRMLGWLIGSFAGGSLLQACKASNPTVVSSRNNGSPTATSSSSSSTSSSSTSSTTAVPDTTTSTTSPTTSTTSTTTSTTSPTSSTTSSTSVPPQPASGAYDREALYVALYGFPGSAVLGVLGEQDARDGAARALEVASAYAGFGRRVVPTFEMLASVASASAGPDGDYSNEFPVERYQSHLDVAAANGMHVVFDLQPGRSRFPDQARQYRDLWLAEHTSIALDPEWRVGADQRPGGGLIGTVDAAEVNETIDYIDGLVTEHGLPPKMCIVHQFDPSMITNKQLIRGTDNVQVVLQMDGFGTLELKQGSWGRMVSDLPAGAFTGWKNFYDEDIPTPTPADTMDNTPQPRYVSYQ